MPNTIKSKAQAGFLGAIASGAKPTSGKGPTPKVARKILRDNAGFRMKSLPDRAPGKRGARKVSTRGRR